MTNGEMTYAEARYWLTKTLAENRQCYDNLTIKAIEKALFAFKIIKELQEYVDSFGSAVTKIELNKKE